MGRGSGRHFLQIPGPTNVPDRVIRAMARPTVDHRGPDFGPFVRQVLDRVRAVFDTTGEVLVFPGSATGGWEAALINTLSPGDRVLMANNGVFASNWQGVASRVGLDVESLEGDWRRATDPNAIADRLARDPEHTIKAVTVVHNETSTGTTTSIEAVRAALDGHDHPALLMVDAVSSLGSIPYRHDAWRVDVTVAGSQKGLMLPPGLSLNAVSAKARAASAAATCPRAYWDWEPMRQSNEDGYFPYTPATNLLFGLHEVLSMFEEETYPRVYARHARLAEAARRAVTAWGLDIYATEPVERSDTVTAVLAPSGIDADDLRSAILERYDMSLGAGLGRLKGQVFRIGHLGHFNDLMLGGTLCGVEMGLNALDVPGVTGGVTAALEYLVACPEEPA